MKPITVVLAEDHNVVREGLRELLDMENDIEVVGEATNGRDAVERVRRLRPAVVVMDIAMPRLNGLEASRQILAELPATKILILSAHGDDPYVEQVAAIGVAGYLLKQTSGSALCKAIRRIHNGQKFYAAPIARLLREALSPRGAKGQSNTKITKLTGRERQVLQLVAEGLANKQTADELGISIKTVEKHRQSVMNKLNVHDTAGLTRYAIANGIIEASVQLTIE